jgi:3-hydroxy-9,10-secoandrosta-1,3,5(10)-triene-9,17-dione monooxygenase reductase component
MPVSIDDFRAVMSRWSSVITVVTARHNHQVHGMVASSFASVSTDPVTILVCAAHSTRTYPLIRAAGAFAVSILTAEQEDTFRVFAGQKGDRDADKFAGLETLTAATGAPILKNGLGWFDCRVLAEYPGGSTHSIIVGQVLAADLGAGADLPPLVYHHRKVRRLAVEQ